MRHPIPASAVVGDEIDAAAWGRDWRRLYLLDGGIPITHGSGGGAGGGHAKGQGSGSAHCLINEETNAVMSPALRTDRPDSLFHFMKARTDPLPPSARPVSPLRRASAPAAPLRRTLAAQSVEPMARSLTPQVETSGPASWSMFAPLGGGPPLTAFHNETKGRRSLNAGLGDLIVQPLAVSSLNLKLERIHAAITGSHARHARLLPLELYLEEARGCADTDGHPACIPPGHGPRG